MRLSWKQPLGDTRKKYDRWLFFVIPPEDWDRYRALYGRPDLLARIKSVERYATRLLPFIPRGLPVYQSHGIGHSLAIIRHINQLLTIPGFQQDPGETFLLYLAAWVHDLGYLHPGSLDTRSAHPGLSVTMIRRDATIRELVWDEEQLPLEDIIRNHDTHTDFTMIRQSSQSYRTMLLAALFRLADALDLGKDRCPPEVFILIEDGLDDHSRNHWLAHQNIKECIIDNTIIRVMVHDLENRHFRERIVPHLEEDCRSSGIIFERYGLTPLVPEYQDDAGFYSPSDHVVHSRSSWVNRSETDGTPGSTQRLKFMD